MSTCAHRDHFRQLIEQIPRDDMWFAVALVVLAVHLFLRLVLARRHRCSAQNPHDDERAELSVEREAASAPEATGSLETRRIVVTGGCGMIGSRVAAHFVERGADVVILDAVLPHSSRVVEGAVYAPLVDLGNENASAILESELRDADCVVHTAGLVVLSHQPSLLRRVHVDGTRALVDAARRCGVRAFVLTSTAGVLQPRPNSSCTVSADAPSVGPCEAISCYGRSKARAERIVLRADDGARGGLRTVALRLPGVWGVGDNMIAEPLLRGEIPAMPVPPFWRANARVEGAVLDLLYVENAAAAHCAAAAALLGHNAVGSGRVFNVTNDEPQVSFFIYRYYMLCEYC